MSEKGCPNCTAEFVGEYCPACGQKKIHAGELTASHFFQGLAEDLTDFRHKFKTIRSLGALFKPGFLTKEYLSGRRQRYLSPLKLFLICAAIFFFASPWAGFNLSSLIQDDKSGELAKLVSNDVIKRDVDQSLLNERFDLRLRSIYPMTLGVGIIVMASLLHLIFRKKNHPFGAHLIFALYYFSFLYLVTIAAGASRRLGLTSEMAGILAICLLVPYLFLALKLVYSESIPSILLKTVLLQLLIFAINFITSSVAIRLTLALI